MPHYYITICNKLRETKFLELVTVNETVTYMNNVAEYEHMQKWMVEYLSKFPSSGIKIARDDSIRITKYINLL